MWHRLKRISLTQWILILAGTWVSFDLPLAGVVLIVGLDEWMDRARTTVNLVGNCLACAVMARWEGGVNFR